MARNDGRIEKGQRLSSAISARAWNRAQEAADIVLGVQPGAEAGSFAGAELASNVVLVRNDYNATIPVFGVIGILGVAIDPSGGSFTGSGVAADRARQFAAKPVLTGVPPWSNINVGERIAIALEPIESGKVGRAAVGGCFPCKVYIEKASHGFAGPLRSTPIDEARFPGGGIWELYSADCGPVQLLWKESGQVISDRWAVGLM